MTVRCLLAPSILALPVLAVPNTDTMTDARRVASTNLAGVVILEVLDPA